LNYTRRTKLLTMFHYSQ